MAALEVYRTGLDKFPNEVTFLTGVARIYEAIGNLSLSAKYYKVLLVVRLTNTKTWSKVAYDPQFWLTQPLTKSIWTSERV